MSKSKEERQRIADHVLMKLDQSGANNDAYPAVVTLKKLLLDYVNNPDDMPGFSGKIPFPELKTHILYKLPMRACNDSHVELVDPRPSGQVTRKGWRKKKQPPSA